MPKIYRTMLKGADDKPVVGDQSCRLGVRIPIDISPNETGQVHPSTGGLSVSPSMKAMPAHLVPKRLMNLIPSARGKNEYSVWSMGSGAFTADPITDRLSLRLENEHHGLVEPSIVMPLAGYKEALESTQNDWSEDENL